MHNLPPFDSAVLLPTLLLCAFVRSLFQSTRSSFTVHYSLFISLSAIWLLCSSFCAETVRIWPTALCSTHLSDNSTQFISTRSYSNTLQISVLIASSIYMLHQRGWILLIRTFCLNIRISSKHEPSKINNSPYFFLNQISVNLCCRLVCLNLVYSHFS